MQLRALCVKKMYFTIFILLYSYILFFRRCSFTCTHQWICDQLQTCVSMNTSVVLTSILMSISNAKPLNVLVCYKHVAQEVLEQRQRNLKCVDWSHRVRL